MRERETLFPSFGPSMWTVSTVPPADLNAATPASKLPITVAQGSLAARNYDFTVFKDGTLTVKDLFVPPAPPPSAWRRDLPPASDGVGDEDRDGNDEDTLSSLDSHVVR